MSIGIVPPAIHVPISMPTEMRMRIAGIVFAIFSATESMISFHEYPRRQATRPATTAEAMRRGSTGSSAKM